jgi:hypothetical protein
MLKLLLMVLMMLMMMMLLLLLMMMMMMMIMLMMLLLLLMRMMMMVIKLLFMNYYDVKVISHFFRPDFQRGGREKSAVRVDHSDFKERFETAATLTAAAPTPSTASNRWPVKQFEPV